MTLSFRASEALAQRLRRAEAAVERHSGEPGFLNHVAWEATVGVMRRLREPDCHGRSDMLRAMAESLADAVEGAEDDIAVGAELAAFDREDTEGPAVRAAMLRSAQSSSD